MFIGKLHQGQCGVFIEIKPFSAVYVDKRVFVFVIDQDLLCSLAFSIDVFAIMRAEFEMNDT